MKRRVLLAVGLVFAAAGAEAAPIPSRQDLVFVGGARPVLLRIGIQVDGKAVAERWSEFVKELFQSLDANHDGVLTGKEIERVPPPQWLFGGPDRDSAIPLEQLDRNADGKVSLDELTEYT